MKYSKSNDDNNKTTSTTKKDEDSYFEMALAWPIPEFGHLTRAQERKMKEELKSKGLNYTEIGKIVVKYRVREILLSFKPHEKAERRPNKNIFSFFGENKNPFKKIDYLNIYQVLKTISFASNHQRPECGIQHINVGKDEKVTIVGNLDGRLEDLFAILETNGYPSKQNRYIFNGNYVEYGDKGLETLMAIMFLKYHYKNFVFLVRGNHELDQGSKHYSFKTEIFQKLGNNINVQDAYKNIIKFFENLNLGFIINKEYAVFHSGFPISEKEEEEMLNAKNYNKPVEVDCLCDRNKTDENDRQLVYALWNDYLPDSDKEKEINRNVCPDGECIYFNKKYVKKFLDYHGLKGFIRSHSLVVGDVYPYKEFTVNENNFVFNVISCTERDGMEIDGNYLTISYDSMGNSFLKFGFVNDDKTKLGWKKKKGLFW